MRVSAGRFLRFSKHTPAWKRQAGCRPAAGGGGRRVAVGFLLVGKAAPGHLRISYAAAVERLEEALRRIQRFAEKRSGVLAVSLRIWANCAVKTVHCRFKPVRRGVFQRVSRILDQLRRNRLLASAKWLRAKFDAMDGCGAGPIPRRARGISSVPSSCRTERSPLWLPALPRSRSRSEPSVK